MRKMIAIPALALCLLTNLGHCADILTCQDVIDAKDQATMRQTILPFRDIGFRTGASREATLVYQGLLTKGISSPLPGLLDYYEQVLIPARAGAATEFDTLVSNLGGLSATIAAICPKRDTDMIGFFSNFYHLYLYRAADSQGQQDTK